MDFDVIAASWTGMLAGALLDRFILRPLVEWRVTRLRHRGR